MKVSVSVLKEYDRLINAVKKVNDSSADYIHIDVMDGIFVDNKKFPLEVVKDVKSISKKPLDVHMMVESEQLIKDYATTLLPYYITFHVEILKNSSIIDYIKNLGVKVGIAINPETDYKKLIPYLNIIDLVLIMSVKPGEGGQKFIQEVLEKVKEIRKINSDIEISIDGGINDCTIKLAKEAGCTMAVSGSYVTNSDNYNEKIKSLK